MSTDFDCPFCPWAAEWEHAAHAAESLLRHLACYHAYGMFQHEGLRPCWQDKVTSRVHCWCGARFRDDAWAEHLVARGGALEHVLALVLTGGVG